MKLSRKKTVENKKLVASSIECPKALLAPKSIQGNRPVRLSAEFGLKQKKKPIKKSNVKRSDTVIRNEKRSSKCIASMETLQTENLTTEVPRFRKDLLKIPSNFKRKPIIRNSILGYLPSRRKPPAKIENSRKDREVQKLKKELQERNALICEMIEKGIPKEFFITLHSTLTEKGIQFTRLVSEIASDSSVETQKFIDLFQKHGIFEENLRKVLPAVIPVDILMDLYQKYDTGNVQSSLQDLSLKMQLYKIPKEDFANAVLGDEAFGILNKKQLKKLLEESPFHVKNPDSLAEFLLGRAPEMSVGKISQRLMESVGQWVVFTVEEEKRLDKALFDLISANNLGLYSQCREADTDKDGFLNVECMLKVLRKQGLSLDNGMDSYLKCLFYSFELDTNKICYRTFFQSFLQPLEIEENEEERATVLKRYLGVVARNLVKKSLGVREVFNSKEGFVYPEYFVKGLACIGMDDLEEDEVVMLIEALQYEGTCRRVCIKLEDLENLLKRYGVESRPCEESCDSVIIHNDTSLDNLHSLTFW